MDAERGREAAVSESEANRQLDILKQHAKAAKTFLDEKLDNKPEKHFDPQRPPFRSPEPVEIKPRLKKEEYKEYNTPVQLAYNGDLLDLLLVSDGQDDLPGPADLDQTIEVQFTEDIQNLADELGHNPARIYNWVRDHIEYVPVRGSIQGGNYCLSTRKCNAWDTSSLLIALLRASGIPARYVIGVVDIPYDQVSSERKKQASIVKEQK